MGIFGNKKDNTEAMQTQDIKEASNPSNLGVAADNSNPFSNQANTASNSINTPNPFQTNSNIQESNLQNPFTEQTPIVSNNTQQNSTQNQTSINPNPFENNQNVNPNFNHPTQTVIQTPIVSNNTQQNTTQNQTSINPNPFENNPLVQPNSNNALNLGSDLNIKADLESPSNQKNVNSDSTSNDLANLNSSIPNSSQSKEEIQEMIDETVEKVIEEKWEKLLKSIEKVVNWKERQEKEVELLKSTMNEVKESFGKLEKKITNKISSYDSGLLDVNSEIKALEKVFQKITPTLVNNVNNLEKIAESIKNSTGVKVEKDKSKK